MTGAFSYHLLCKSYVKTLIHTTMLLITVQDTSIDQRKQNYPNSFILLAPLGITKEYFH